MKQSLTFPYVFIAGCIAAAVFCAVQGWELAFALCVILFCVGVQEVRATNLHNEDIERFRSE